MVETGVHWYDDEIVLPGQICHLNCIASWSLYQCQMSRKYCLNGFSDPTVQLPSLDNHCLCLGAADKIVYLASSQMVLDKITENTVKKIPQKTVVVL
jgi:hypothetical protein